MSAADGHGRAIPNKSCTQNRELSWLAFNARVLAEAEDESVPLLERLKFLAIFSSNLDEFFMIRVGSLHTLAAIDPTRKDIRSGLTPHGQLDRIHAAVTPLYLRLAAAYSTVEAALSANGLCRVPIGALTPRERKYIRQYFKTVAAPVLSPQIVDAHHPFPHLAGKTPHIAMRLARKKSEVLGLLPVPASLPALVFLSDRKDRYVLIEDVLHAFADTVFEMYTVLEKTVFCVTRNADVSPDDDTFDAQPDFRRKMEKVLRRRKRLGVVRVELTEPVSGRFSAVLRARFGVDNRQMFLCRAPLRLAHAFSLGQALPPPRRAALSYPPFAPQPAAMLDMRHSLLRQVLRHDVLLSYPYESMEPFLQLVREAASDRSVLSIRITIYRLARKAKLVEYLCAAAENGKDVTVLIELRARFDEQNNIDWSERLEDAGCKIIYGLEHYKVHAKIFLITLRDRGQVRLITQIGTGNFNEKTAEQYTDVSLITADASIGADACAFWSNMALGSVGGTYRRLLVAPTGFKPAMLALIDAQTAKGPQGYILLKFNSLTDIDIIGRLCQASCAGVRVELFVRGICCLLPGVEGKTENISVTSIVGRFLEHSRIFCFGTGAAQQMYLSSADLMTRNTERRVELACPIDDPAVRARLHGILSVLRQDTAKARCLQADGSYVPKPSAAAPVDAQALLMREAQDAACLAAGAPCRPSLWRKALRRLRGRAAE